MNKLAIYKSSAGSGKTYTLVKEYLKLVLHNPSAFRQTLAITFTNKATAEMKQRIVEALVELAENRNPGLESLLQEELKQPNYSIGERAQTVLENIMHDYSGFAVSTIDSFFSRMMRSLAREMHLPLKFEMEMNQDYISTRLAGMIMDDIGRSDELTHWLEQFVFTKMEDEKGWNIEHEITQMAKAVFSDSGKGVEGHQQRIDLVFINLLKKIKNTFESRMKVFGDDFLTLLASHGLEVGDFAYKESGVAGYFLKISGTPALTDWEPGKRFTAALDDPEKWAAAKSGFREQIVSLASATLIPHARQAIEYYQAHFEDYASALKVLTVAYMAGLMHFLKEKLTEYRDENEVLMLSDTNFLLKKFISGNDTPFVYEKTGNRYKNFLLDEFQDTSDLQWENLLPLLINGLASGGFVLLVGDAKQSIYRWRGGNLRLLLEKIHHDLSAFESIKLLASLDTNYRSLKEVVNFNNTFFSITPLLLPTDAPELPALAYQSRDTVQKNSEKKASAGFVEAVFFKKSKDDEGKETHWKKQALDRMLEVVRKSQEKGYCMNDIAILVRTNQDGKDVASHLFSNGITKISSADSLLISQAPQVTFLINCMKALADPDDQPALAEVIWFYVQFLRQQDVPDPHLVFNAVVRDPASQESMLPDAWKEEKNRLLTLPVYELSEQLLPLFSLNARPDAYIQRFLDMVLEYSGKNPPSVKGFLNWWQDHRDSEKFSVIVPEEKDALTILSIHRSKGLQFPVVIIPFLCWDLKPKDRSLLWITSEMEPYRGLEPFPVEAGKILSKTHFASDYQQEVNHSCLDNLNLLYVAFTRAEEKLFLFAPESDPEAEEIKSTAHLLSAAVQGNPLWREQLTELDDGMILRLGNDHEVIRRREAKEGEGSFEQPATMMMEKFLFNRWQDKISIRVQDGFRSTGEEDALSATDFGLLLHETMSLVKIKSDLPLALERIQRACLVSDEEIKKLKAEVERIFRLTDREKWFEPEARILNESELINPDGAILRPDRVMLLENEAIVIDYKTGIPDEEHQTQVHRYLQALRAMGYSRTSGYLVYLRENRILQVI